MRWAITIMDFYHFFFSMDKAGGVTPPPCSECQSPVDLWCHIIAGCEVIIQHINKHWTLTRGESQTAYDFAVGVADSRSAPGGGTKKFIGSRRLSTGWLFVFLFPPLTSDCLFGLTCWWCPANRVRFCPLRLISMIALLQPCRSYCIHFLYLMMPRVPLHGMSNCTLPGFAMFFVNFLSITRSGICPGRWKLLSFNFQFANISPQLCFTV